MVALEIDTVDFAFHRGAEREHLAEDFKVVLGNSGGTVGGSRFRTGCPFIETKANEFRCLLRLGSMAATIAAVNSHLFFAFLSSVLS